MSDDPNRPSPAFESFLIWYSGEPQAKKRIQIKHLARESALDDLIRRAIGESHSSKGLECPDFWKAVKMVKNFGEYLSFQDLDGETIRLIAKASAFVENANKALIKSRMSDGWLLKAARLGEAFYKNADGTMELRKIKGASYLQKGETSMAAKEAYDRGIISKEDRDNAIEWEKAMDEASAEMRARLELAPKGNENKLVSIAHPPESLDGAKCEETDDPRFMSCSSDVGKAKHPSRPSHHATKPKTPKLQGHGHSGRAGGAMGYHEERNPNCQCEECIQNEKQNFDLRQYI
jgi:hypothetical protein